MEMNFREAALRKLIVHYVGSKNNLDSVFLSRTALTLDEQTSKAISDSFLSRFNWLHEYYSFTHPSSLNFNEVYNYASQLFDAANSFEEVSTNIAKHLYESSSHPKVKGGELYVAFFEGLPIDGRMHKGIGLFKTENKSLFLDVQKGEDELELNMREGVELNKIDKGCIIINNKQDAGYDVLIFDNQNRGEEALYWKEKFLGIEPQKNEYHQTQHLLMLTKQYITEQLEPEFNTPKQDQIKLLSKSIDYFKHNEAFDINEFQEQVFNDDGMVESFRNFGSKYTQHHDFDIASNFEISPMAVKKQMRIYKSVLKLDKNFHIYIHGNTDLIEKGIDMDGRKYYKIYYQDEA